MMRCSSLLSSAMGTTCGHYLGRVKEASTRWQKFLSRSQSSKCESSCRIWKHSSSETGENSSTHAPDGRANASPTRFLSMYLSRANLPSKVEGGAVSLLPGDWYLAQKYRYWPAHLVKTSTT